VIGLVRHDKSVSSDCDPGDAVEARDGDRAVGEARATAREPPHDDGRGRHIDEDADAVQFGDVCGVSVEGDVDGRVEVGVCAEAVSRAHTLPCDCRDVASGRDDADAVVPCVEYKQKAGGRKFHALGAIKLCRRRVAVGEASAATAKECEAAWRGDANLLAAVVDEDDATGVYGDGPRVVGLKSIAWIPVARARKKSYRG
jgi:hypothetical protein